MSTHLEIFQAERIKALEAELQRVNNELLEVKQVAFKARVSDPVYLKPISMIEVDFDLISQTKKM